MVGTGNTSGRGANPSYPERRPFDAAFSDRFVYIEWGYDEELEKRIALNTCPTAAPLVEWVHKIRAWAVEEYPRLVPSPRCTYRLANVLQAISQGEPLSFSEALDSIIFKGDHEAREKVFSNFEMPDFKVTPQAQAKHWQEAEKKAGGL